MMMYASLYVHYLEMLYVGKNSSYLVSNKEHLKLFQKKKKL